MLSVADADTDTVCDTAPLAGVRKLTFGVVESTARFKAAERFRRPLPIPLSDIASALPSMLAASRYEIEGVTCTSNAAAPATIGALNDVPHAPAYPPPG